MRPPIGRSAAAGAGSSIGRKERLSASRRSLRPTTSKALGAVFSMLGPTGPAGLAVLDLYAGTGAFGIESLKRGAERAEFVEIDSRRCSAIRRRLRELQFEERARVHRGEAAKVVSTRLDGRFDVVFADPPYAENPFEPVFSALVGAGLLSEGATLFAEHSVRTELPGELAGLAMTRHREYGDTAISVYRVAPTTE